MLDAAMDKSDSLPSTKRTPFERIVLALQGGGALGAYQGGVYQALAEAHLQPDWVSGISIGAINCAIIAGNPPHERVARLRQFWETVSEAPPGTQLLGSCPPMDCTCTCCSTRRARPARCCSARPTSSRRARRRPGSVRLAAPRRPVITKPIRCGRRWSGWSISTASTTERCGFRWAR